MGKLFNDLAYGQYINTYAGLPLAQAKETADSLEAKYWSNKEAIDNAEITLANLDLHKQDDHIRQESQKDLQSTVSNLVDKGNYEHGTMIVKKATKDIAVNRGLIEALKSRQGQLAGDAALSERIGKSEEENGILPEDYTYEKAKAEQNYTGVYKDVDGIWKGHYAIGEVPKYINIGERAKKFLNEFKPDTYIGRQMVSEPERDKDGGIVKNKDGTTSYQPLVSRTITKTKDGSYVWVEERETADGSYAYYNTTEEAPFEQVYQAAREHIMQSEDVQARVNYDVKKDTSTFASRLQFESKEDARKAIINDLQEFAGYSEKTLNGLSNDKLYELHKKEAVINQGILGAAIHASYVKEDQKLFGMTLQAQLAKSRAKNAKGTGGDDQTPLNNNLIYGVTQGYKGVTKPASLGEYHKAVRDAQTELNKHNTSIEDITTRIKTYEKNKQPVPAALSLEYEQALTSREKYANTIAELAAWSNYAASEVKKEYGDDVFNSYQKDYLPKATELRGKVSDVIENLPLDDKGRIHMDFSAFSEHIREDVTSKNSYTPESLTRIFDELLATGAFGSNNDETSGWTSLWHGLTGQADVVDFAKWFTDKLASFNATNQNNDVQRLNNETAINALYTSIDNFRPTQDKLGKVANVINAKMEERARDLSNNYAFINLSNPAENMSNSKNEEFSNFRKTATSVLHTQPNDFTIINTDGEEVLWQNAKDNDLYKNTNTAIIGKTLQPVGNHGYCWVAIENILDDKGNTIDTKQHLLKGSATVNTGLNQLANYDLARGILPVNGQPKEGIDFAHPNEIVSMWEHENIDNQLAVFQDYPEIGPTQQEIDKGKYHTELVKEIFAGAKYRLQVNRRTNSLGQSKYDVTFMNRLDGSQRIVTDYPNLIEVQKAAELAVQNGSETTGTYQVPLSTLKRVYQNDLTYGKLDKSVVTPYLHDDMVRQLKGFEALYQNNYIIKGLLQSNYSNMATESELDKQPLEGRAVSIAYDQKLFDWLQNPTHSTTGSKGNITNTDLKYTITGTGSNKTINFATRSNYSIPTESFEDQK